jgi:hypothetical protein
MFQKLEELFHNKWVQGKREKGRRLSCKRHNKVIRRAWSPPNANYLAVFLKRLSSIFASELREFFLKQFHSFLIVHFWYSIATARKQRQSWSTDADGGSDQ